MLDRIERVLWPEDGLLAVADFHTASTQPSSHESLRETSHAKTIGGANKECGWLSQWFWQIWFDLDYVS
jgi:betaine lipid synthase